jgi:hypothetical protein
MRIGHYMQGINDPGGVATYIRRLSQAQRKAGHTVYFLDTRPSLAPSDEAGDLPIAVQSDADLFAQARSLNLDILHLHTTISILPPPDLPVIRTLHGHSPYCLSGSKYLKRWGKPCDRPYSLSGCLWGHLIAVVCAPIEHTKGCKSPTQKCKLSIKSLLLQLANF